MVRWVPLAGIASLVLWGCALLLPYARLGLELRRLPLAERGHLASDESQSFLVRAGRTDLRERLARRAERGAFRPSAPAEAWRWCYQEAAGIPPDAVIYLNDPRAAVYFYGTFFWYPARLDASPERAKITGHADLARHGRRLAPNEFGELRKRGYSHVVTHARGGLDIVRLAPEADASP